jgi:asparagine synthetase A
MLQGEKLLWWELDKIAVRESSMGMNIDKANAAENIMKFLEKPTHEECQWQYRLDRR